MRRFAVLAALVAGSLLTGCAVNPFEKYYVDRSGGPEAARKAGVKVFSEPPKLTHGTKSDADLQTMWGEGYALLGVSAFNGKEFPDELALEQATKIGATRVIVYSKYTNTEQGAAPMVLPSIVGITAGAISSTIVGATTTMVPVSQRRYDQGATYWAPSPPGIIGVNARDLTPEERAKLQSNKGVFIFSIKKHSPAFEADILKDDIVRSVDGVEVSDTQAFGKVLNEKAGQKVIITIVRGDQTLIKDVALNRKE
jgi:hypothetical protein